jgi:two-component system, NarL family, invasion response regulator UvrY
LIQALAADDHPLIRSGLRQILAQEPDFSAPGEAESTNEALEKMAQQSWDIVILDSSMPGSGGLDTLPEIRRKYPKLPILILSAYSDPNIASRALQAGASGYLTKREAPGELIRAIRQVARGRKYLSPLLAVKFAEQPALRRGQELHENLSAREYQVACRLASGNRVSEVAHAMGLSVKTVSTYRTRALEKMGFRTNAELTRYALKNGMID